MNWTPEDDSINDNGIKRAAPGLPGSANNIESFLTPPPLKLHPSL